MIKSLRLHLAAIAGIAIGMLGSLAMAEPTATGTDAPLFYNLPPKGKQIALNEAMALDFAAEHVRNADEVANRILTHISDLSAAELETYAKDFKSEAATAYLEITILEDGLESHISDAEYKKEQQVADSMFTLKNGISPYQYRMQLQSMLKTLHNSTTIAAAGFKAKWGVSYTDALQH